MSKTNEELIAIGQKTLEVREKQKAYDKLYALRTKYVMRKLIEAYPNYNALVEESKQMTAEELA